MAFGSAAFWTIDQADVGDAVVFVYSDFWEAVTKLVIE